MQYVMRGQNEPQEDDCELSRGQAHRASANEHESKCAKVHVIVASLSPMIDNSSGSVRYFDGQLTDG